MNHHELIGSVAARYLRNEIPFEDGDGTVRFILDALSADHVASVARAVLGDEPLSQRIAMRLPSHLLQGHGLPPSVLTDRRATHFRSIACDKAALLLANVGDDEEQSLREVSPLGSAQLQASPDLWVSVAGAGLHITDEHRIWWERALKGLHELRLNSLDRFSTYVLRTRRMIEDEGLPLHQALGSALPALRLPKNTALFEAVAHRTHASQWRRLYNVAQAKHACFLLKQNPQGILLSEDELARAFERVRQVIPEAHHKTIMRFIQAPAGWNEAAAALSECEWEEVHALFDGLQRQRFNLAQATQNFYSERDPILLSEDDKEYLVRLASRRTASGDLEEDKEFYDTHRGELREDRKLKSAWDKFIYGKARESTDFVESVVAALEVICEATILGSHRTLSIRCDSRFRKDFRSLNSEAGRYFAVRYRGLKDVLGSRIQWEVGELFQLDAFHDELKERGQLNRSGASAALRLKFVVEFAAVHEGGTEDRRSVQFIWRYDPEGVSSEFVDDWDRLRKHPLVFCGADREPTSIKGITESVDLFDASTFIAAYGHDRGSFVSVYKKDPKRDISLAWRHNLGQAVESGLLAKEASEELLSRLQTFEGEYSASVRGFWEGGLATASIETQAARYAELLGAVCTLAKGDRTRDLLLRPLMAIGAVTVQGGAATVVVAPWHPLRMVTMVRKVRQVARLLGRILDDPEVRLSDPRLFFKETTESLRHPHQPELVLGWDGDNPELLALTDAAGDYSLHEAPFLGELAGQDTNETPTEGANRVVELVQRYLRLHPHEHANLSVVLYNCDSARLPMAVVQKIAALQEDEDDARCQIILRHRDRARLQQLYRGIVESSDDADAFVASEASSDFMARLRISIMADQAPPPDPREGCPEDIVFSQDVIARYAKLEWYPVELRVVPAIDYTPTRWSRRRPAAVGDMKSVVYLCCPVQTREGWEHLRAITSFLRADWEATGDRRLLPARQLNFKDRATSQVFEETHNIANWVANYDELLDRRQLLEQGVRVIRYKQMVTQGRNLIVSSRAPLGLLHSMVLHRLKDLSLGLGEEELQALSHRFVEDANDISGDIVLRAAKSGRSASELLGVVLSRYLVRHELGPESISGWYFLDDYANWLGQREEQIADLLALTPELREGQAPRLTITVTEAKYVDATSLASARRVSQRQLGDTLRRISTALFGKPVHLDRSIWLDRLSDLLVDGVRYHSGSPLDLEGWRLMIRDGRCEIALRGYSHVFVSGPADGEDLSATVPLTDVDGAYQEVFGRPKVRELVLKYHSDEDPQGVRIGGDGESAIASKGFVRVPRRENEHDDDETSASGRQVESQQSEGPGDVSPPESEHGQEMPSPASEGWSVPDIGSWVVAGGVAAADAPEEKAWLRQVENKMKAALQQFELRSKLLSSMLTPNAALLKFAGSGSLTVEQVRRRETEFLTTHGLKLITIQPEPGVVALSVARPTRTTVALRELWRRWDSTRRKRGFDLLIGVREDDGEPLFLSPGAEHAPHTLVAGSTGSGKSVLMQNLLLSIAATNRPDQARIVLIDPKQGVDYFAFEGLPHLDQGIVDDPDESLKIIGSLVSEMDDRYRLLRKARAANLRVFNEKVLASERLPTVWLFHDEFAEWMLVEEYKQEVTAAVARLGVKARAAGIHLVFAAQRPDANVMPMQLRANLGNRLILRVDSPGTSEIALGEKGAERLLGSGQMLARLEGVSSPVLAQVPLVSQADIDDVVGMIRRGFPAGGQASGE